MSRGPMNVMFLCTHDSRRSILAEAVLNQEERFDAFRRTLHAIRHRLDLFLRLPEDRLTKLAIEKTAREMVGR